MAIDYDKLDKAFAQITEVREIEEDIKKTPLMYFFVAKKL